MTYTFKVSLQEEGDGWWSAWIESLPGCATWGYTTDDALQCLHEAAVLVLEDVIECGESIPAEVEFGDGMEVAIHL